MPLFKNNSFVKDEWIHLADDQALPIGGRITVSYERLARDWDALAGYPGVLGARITNTDKAEEIARYISQLALIIVPFPSFADGRSYSVARQLRLDGYRGEIRATGNVLPDQVQYMHQVGIDSYDVSDRFTLEAWQKASRQMSLAYQRGLYRPAGEREVWSERHQGFVAWEEQPHAG